MSDIDDVKAVLNQWLSSLDNGDIQGMLETCDPDVIVANEGQPTTIGVDAVKEKYAPRIAAATFRSGFDIEHAAVYNDFAIIVGHFKVEMTNKTTSVVGGGSGRLALNYRKNASGQWKMILDIDNND